MALGRILGLGLVLVLCCLLPDSQQQDDGVISSKAEAHLAAPGEALFTFDDSILYKINWLEAPSESNKSSEDELVEKPGEEMVFSTASNEQYRCVIPNVDRQAQLDGTSSEVDPNPYELIKPIFTKKMCSYRVENYWTYEICHGRYIRQFHEDPRSRDSVVQEFYLGKFNPEHIDKLIKHYEEHEKGRKRPVVAVEDLTLPYIEVNMTDGTLCDLSNKKRITRVRYVCLEEGNHDLYSIKETSTCEYEVLSFSPLLCKSGQFKVKTPMENEIKCYPVNAQTPTVPRGYQLDDILLEKSRREKQKKRGRGEETLLEELENPFEGKTIFIESVNGKTMRINIVSESENNKRPYTQMARQFLAGEYCLTGGSGWWKYEFCYGKKVDQYHEEKNGKKVAINLGNWDLKEHIKWIEANPSKRPKAGKTPKQVSHFYSYGEACDLTKKPRTVEVKLKCPNSNAPPESVTIYLMEPRTCEYVLGVESAIICELLSTVDENGLFVVPPVVGSGEGSSTEDEGAVTEEPVE